MKGHSLIGAKILGNSKPSSQARQYQIGTVISQLPDLSEPASQSELDSDLLLMARSGNSTSQLRCTKPDARDLRLLAECASQPNRVTGDSTAAATQIPDDHNCQGRYTL